MKYIYYWWTSVDRINFLLILSLGITGIILSFSVDENFSLNKHSIFFIFSLILIFILKRHLLLLMAFASPLIATTSRHRRLSVYLKMQWN